MFILTRAAALEILKQLEQPDKTRLQTALRVVGLIPVPRQMERNARLRLTRVWKRLPAVTEYVAAEREDSRLRFRSGALLGGNHTNLQPTSYRRQNMETRFTKDKRDELDAKARALIKWLNNNGHPHMSIRVHTTGYELTEDLVGSGQIMDYVID